MELWTHSVRHYTIERKRVFLTPVDSGLVLVNGPFAVTIKFWATKILCCGSGFFSFKEP